MIGLAAIGLASGAEAMTLIDLVSQCSASIALLAARNDGHLDARAMPAGTSVSVARGLAAIEALGLRWRAVADAPDIAVFQSHAWTVAAARYHEGRGALVEVALVERDGRIEAALPIAVRRQAGVRVGVFLGDPAAQYGDIWSARGGSTHVARAALAHLIAVTRADVLEFRRVRSDAAVLPALLAMADPTGAPTDAPYADLGSAASVDAMLRTAGGAKQARERSRSRRRLAEQGAITLDVRRGCDAVPIVAEALALKRAWLAEKGFASAVLDDPEAFRALSDIAQDPAEGRGVVAMRLLVGGVPAAYEVGLVSGRRYHAYLGAVVETFANHSPGKVQMEEALLWCCAEGIETYDLLPSEDAYKRQWATGAVPVQDFVVAVTALGRFYAGPWLTLIRPWLATRVRRLPPVVRRAVMKASVVIGAR